MALEAINESGYHNSMHAIVIQTGEPGEKLRKIIQLCNSFYLRQQYISLIFNTTRKCSKIHVRNNLKTSFIALRKYLFIPYGFFVNVMQKISKILEQFWGCLGCDYDRNKLTLT